MHASGQMLFDIGEDSLPCACKNGEHRLAAAIVDADGAVFLSEPVGSNLSVFPLIALCVEEKITSSTGAVVANPPCKTDATDTIEPFARDPLDAVTANEGANWSKAWQASGSKGNGPCPIAFAGEFTNEWLQSGEKSGLVATPLLLWLAVVAADPGIGASGVGVQNAGIAKQGAEDGASLLLRQLKCPVRLSLVVGFDVLEVAAWSAIRDKRFDAAGTKQYSLFASAGAEWGVRE